MLQELEGNLNNTVQILKVKLVITRVHFETQNCNPS